MLSDLELFHNLIRTKFYKLAFFHAEHMGRLDLRENARELMIKNWVKND